MAAILYRSLTIARLWALLEAHTGFTDLVAQPRRVTDTKTGIIRRLVLGATGDFPFVEVLMGDRFGGQGIPTTTFASEVGEFGRGASDEWVEPLDSEFKINIVYENKSFADQDALEMEVMAAIEAGGQDLGYTNAISDWGPWRANRTGKTIIREIERPVTVIVFPVKYEFTGAQLKP
jgi:hypothetical protein